jgi:protein CpxP
MGRFGGPGGPGGFGGRFGLPLGQLGLTDAQHDQIRSIVENHRTEMQEVAKRVQTARHALRQAETAEPFNEGGIRTASDALNAVQTDAAVLRARVRSEVLQVLTPEQRAKATQLRAEREQRQLQRQQRMKERRQNRLPRQPQQSPQPQAQPAPQPKPGPAGV